MRPDSSACCSSRGIVRALAAGWGPLGWLLAACLLTGCAADESNTALVQAPQRAQVLLSAEAALPDAAAPWQQTGVPDWRPGERAVWYRVTFDVPPVWRESWAVYLPYLYGGGAIVLNGSTIEHIGSLSSGQWVRWERPHLVVFPDALLRAGGNVLLLRAEASPIGNSPRLAPLLIGERSALQRAFAARYFAVTALPQLTAIACAVAAVFMFFIYWRRRSEVLYGLFGLAVAMWGVRTMHFVIEALPAPWWPAWRTLYFASTGGFIVALMLFTMRMAGQVHRRVEAVVLAYWALGPLVYVFTRSQDWLSRVWIGGFVPVGMALGAFAVVAAWRRRSVANIALAVSVVIGVLCGVHDYLLAIGSETMRAWLPQWTAQRLFLLHHGANLLLLVMGAVLAGRFLGALREVELANRTLESRVAARERELATSYRQLADLQRAQAAAEERALLVRDLHDGLGSVLFTSLARAERGDMAGGDVAQMLRECIAEMRLVFEATPPDERDFAGVFGSFRFRWQQLLQAQGIRSEWAIELPPGSIEMAPHNALQVLRVLQEALTNALKHARATSIRVSIARAGDTWCLAVEDDGDGIAAAGDAPREGRGIGNMERRAQRIGGELSVDSGGRGTRVTLRIPTSVTHHAAAAG